MYLKRRDEVRAGVVNTTRAPGVYSERVQRGGVPKNVVTLPGPGLVEQGYTPGEQQGYVNGAAPIQRGAEGVAPLGKVY